jgi:hypothetical protein
LTTRLRPRSASTGVARPRASSTEQPHAGGSISIS